MISKWFNLKNKAITLRKSGKSIRNIETKLGIPRSTLSGWLKHIELTIEQKKKLKDKANKALFASREKALLWHHSQKENRINKAKEEANEVLGRININDINILELALSFLYLGEGSKKNTMTSIGNTNPLILKFFISSVKKVYPDAKLGRFELHLRSDQNETDEIRYWANELKVNINDFGFVKDKRIAKSKTYSDYHGVCVVRFTEVSIQRRLVFLSHMFCNIITATDS